MAKTSDIYIFDTENNVKIERNVPKPELRQLQKLVGGLIQSVSSCNLAVKRGVDVWVNEEGLCFGMKINQTAQKYLGCQVVGPVVVVDNRSNRTKSPFHSSPV